jgi:hypothetical protein
MTCSGRFCGHWQSRPSPLRSRPPTATARSASPGAIGRFAAAVDRADFLREFFRREPERALRILTTRAGTIQSRLVASIETLLKEEVSQGNLHSPLPVRDLAYLIVRIVESFLYAELITGEEPDIAMAELAVGALPGRQDPETG